MQSILNRLLLHSMFKSCHFEQFFCRVVENGVETITTEENGMITSKRVNGQEMLEAGPSQQQTRKALKK